VAAPASEPLPRALVVTRGLLESAVSALWNERNPLPPGATVPEAQAIATDADAVTARLWSILNGHDSPLQPEPEPSRNWLTDFWKLITGKP
jgi:hypothetical protein